MARAKKSTLRADLTDGRIRAIRRKYAKGRLSHREIGEEYGLTAKQVGRITRGEVREAAGGPVTSQARTRLTKREIAKVRRRYSSGKISQVALAREYGVNSSTISEIVRGATHADVDGPLVDAHQLPRGRKLTAQQIMSVARSTESLSVLARKYGVSRQAIHQHRRRWAPRLAERESGGDS